MNLFAKLASGDDTAVPLLQERYGRLIWYLARKHSDSINDAEDAVQEIVLDLWRSASKYNPSVASETTFVTMVARRRLIDRRRKRNRIPPSVELPSEELTFAEPAAVSHDDEMTKIRKCFGELPPEQQTVLRLFIDRGLSHSEIALETKLPLGTVKSHARRGLIRIRELLGLDVEKGGRS